MVINLAPRVNGSLDLFDWENEIRNFTEPEETFKSSERDEKQREREEEHDEKDVVLEVRELLLKVMEHTWGRLEIRRKVDGRERATD